MKKLILAFLVLANIAQAKVVKKSVDEAKPYNVVFIALDALQANHVHSLGYEKPTTPFFDELSKKGVLFENAISPASWTVPTYLSVFTSTFPSEHGMTNRYVKFEKDEKVLSNFTKTRPELKTIAQILKDRGYKTAGFTGDSGLSSVLGYNAGFDEYTDDVPFGGLDNSDQKSNSWVQSLRPDEKFFLFIHGYDCHGQFNVGDSYNGKWTAENKVETFKGTSQEQAKIRETGLAKQPVVLSPKEINFWRSWYDSKIFDADNRLKKIYSELETKGLLKNTIVVIFSDHGTEFMEHGKFDHGHTLYDELIHVPLLIIPPWKTTGKKIKEQVSTLDVLPTVLDLLPKKEEKDLKSQIKGVSLAQTLKGKAAPKHDVYTETDCRNFTHKRAIRTADGWKYIMTLEDGSDELYDLKGDPKETKNLVSEKTDKAKALRTRLMDHLASMKVSSQTVSTKCLPVYKGQCE